MAPFRFRLEKVLRFRRDAQRQAQMALAASERSRDRQRTALAAAEAGVAECHARIKASPAGGPAHDAAAVLGRLRQRGLAVHTCAARAKAAEEEASRCRNALVAARVRTKTLSTLRERLREAHQRDAARREARIQDEVAQTGAARQRRQTRVGGKPACAASSPE